jgi:hypothetical protein
MRINNNPTRVPQRASDTQTQSTATPRQANTLVRSAPRDGFEKVSSRSEAAPSRGGDVQSLLREQFGSLAADKQQFHEQMRGIFGEGYDSAKAEQYRQQALEGNFDWMPPVKWVDSQVLGGAHGAYDSESGTVLLNSALQGNPELAASTYVEEAGHHLDAQLNTVDSAGDEGELFRRILGGEKLTKAQVAEIRAENDKGTIQLNGKSVQVEFWNPFKAIGNAVKSVGNAIVDGAKAVGNAVVNTAKEVGNAVVSVGKGLVGGAKTFFTGIGEGVGGFFSNIVQGKVADAFQSLVRGADKAFLQAPLRIFNGVLDGAQNLVNGVSHLLGPLGKPVREIGTRVLDATRTLTDTATGIVRDAFRTVTEAPLAVVRGVEEAIKLATQGKWGEAAKRLGQGFAEGGIRLVGGAVDVIARGIQGAVNAALTLSFAEAPSRGLSDSEIKMLKEVYGDSIDYSVVRVKQGGSTDWTGMAPHVVGNTIYMPSQWGGDNFNADGSFTENGLETLVHEMGHVWQNQNGGGDFVHRSLLAQLIATIESGSRNGAYEWREGYSQGRPFEELNPEQQAHLIEDIGKGLKDDGSVTAGDWSPPLSPAELSYVMKAWEMVKRGEGAR